MGFLDVYEPVEDRLRAFWRDHTTGRVLTELVKAEDGIYIVKAKVYRMWDGPVSATGLATERDAERGVNATSALENCETSAIGRALANLGYAAKGKRPSREEMSKTPPGTRAPGGAGGRESGQRHDTRPSEDTASGIQSSSQPERPGAPARDEAGGGEGDPASDHGSGPGVAEPSSPTTTDTKKLWEELTILAGGFNTKARTWLNVVNHTGYTKADAHKATAHELVAAIQAHKEEA
jgi:hypothetical protein